ncbi:MAG: hypothetical protein AAF682_14395 [Planctomycetota bacterium]
MLAQLTRRVALATLVALGPAAGLASAQLYEIEDLGTFGGPTSAANAINESGAVVGWATTAAGTQWGFHLWQGVRINLTHITGAFTAEALGVSNNIEESCGWALNSQGQRRGMLWVFDTIIDVGTLGGTEAQSYDLNTSRVVGWAHNASGQRRPFQRVGLSLIDLGTLGGPTGEAHAINDFHYAAGMSEIVAPGPAPVNHATVWAGTLTLDLGTLGGTNSVAEGMNELCQVVGGAETGAAGEPEHAFLWLPLPAYGLPVGMNDLGTLGDAATSRAWAISDAGEVVGQSGTNDADGALGTRAFVWDGVSGMRDLNNHIITDDDWVLLTARGVNNAGDIVGAGLHAGVLRGYRLTRLP